MNNALELLKQLSSDLGLNFEYQDWGIINSSPDRVLEFINYFEKHQNFDYPLRYALVELIIASVNDALLEGKFDERIAQQFKQFIDKHINEELYQTIFNYWIRIKNNQEFPIGEHLAAIKCIS